MAYSTTTSITDQDDLMSQVSTFAVARGWTEDNYDAVNKKMSLHKGNCYVHFFWNDTSTNGATYGTSIGMYQSLGYIDAATASHAHTNDSQNGASTAATLSKERGIKYIGPGPYTALHLHGHTDTDVIYCILEYAPGLYSHFAFGNIEKVGTWTGGEFVAGHHWTPEQSGTSLDDPKSTLHNFLLDGVNFNNAFNYPDSIRIASTIHMEGLPNQQTENPYYGAVGSWSNMITASAYTEGRDGNERAIVYGGCRDGIGVQQFGWAVADVSKGYIPIIPVELFYVYNKTGESDDFYYLGRMAHAGMIQLAGIDPAQALTIGAETWRAYPCVRKSKVGSNAKESWDMGMIYKQ